MIVHYHCTDAQPKRQSPLGAQTFCLADQLGAHHLSLSPAIINIILVQLPTDAVAAVAMVLSSRQVQGRLGVHTALTVAACIAHSKACLASADDE